MEAFIQRHRQDVIGVLRGFDRMRFRGTRRDHGGAGVHPAVRGAVHEL
jgi:hypothetical protein